MFFSLAQAAYVPGLLPQALYDGETLVGFVMYTITPDKEQFWIMRILIDKAHQHKGYGLGTPHGLKPDGFSVHRPRYRRVSPKRLPGALDIQGGVLVPIHD